MVKDLKFVSEEEKSKLTWQQRFILLNDKAKL